MAHSLSKRALRPESRISCPLAVPNGVWLGRIGQRALQQDRARRRAVAYGAAGSLSSGGNLYQKKREGMHPKLAMIVFLTVQRLSFLKKGRAG